MQAWPRPDVPRLPGTGIAPRLHDTATGTRIAASGPSATLYVCGITPYDATHLGHAATYVGFDLLVRAWLDAGFDVRYAQNVTDIDDPLLERAARDGRDWRDIAREQVALFASDMAALRVVPPDAYVGVVEAIPTITAFIERVRDRGAVYGIDGDLYFAVASSPSFGSVSNLSAGQMLPLFAERGGDPDRAGKKDPLDSLLWRAERAGEPAWDSPLGRGRPGWHAECSAIALAELGDTVDVQGGGSDLIFPHHETCAALSELVTGKPCAHAYAHAGMVAYDGEKMSKSLGNLVFVSKLVASGVDPMAIRLALLAHHYRDDWEWTGADLDAANARLQRWRTAVASAGADGEALDVVTAIRERLADDLDAPGALAVIDQWADGSGADAATVRRAADALLGIAL